MIVLRQTPYLRVRDIERSLAFYQDALGFTVAQSLEAEGHRFWTLLVNGEAAVMLSDRPARIVAHDDDAPPDHGTWSGVPATLNPDGDINLVTFLYVENCNMAHARLAGGGYDILQPPKSQPWGIRDFLIRDPDGYVYAITQRISAAAQ